jgi:hypothetical protein
VKPNRVHTLCQLMRVLFLVVSPLALSAQLPACRPTHVIMGALNNPTTDTLALQYGPQGITRAGNTKLGEMTMERDAQGRVVTVAMVHPEAGTSVRCPVQYDAQGRCTLYVRPMVTRSVRGNNMNDAVTTFTYKYTPVQLTFNSTGQVEYELTYEDIDVQQVPAPRADPAKLKTIARYTWQGANMASKTSFRWTPFDEGNPPALPNVQQQRTLPPPADQPQEQPRREYLRQTDSVHYQAYSSFPNPQLRALKGMPQGLLQSAMLPSREVSVGLAQTQTFETAITPDAAHPSLPARTERSNTTNPGTFTATQEFRWVCE